MAPLSGGRMLAAALSEEEACAWTASCEGAVDVAAVNGPHAVTLSGDAGALEELRARLAERLRRHHLDLDDQAFARLVHACEEHTSGLCDGDVTVLTCWDADRLDLLRCRIEPRPELLCTAAARDPALLKWANARARRRAGPGPGHPAYASADNGQRRRLDCLAGLRCARVWR